MKIFKNLYKLVVGRLQVHKIYPAYELTPLHVLDGPLKYFERSAAIETLCITDHLELLLEHILKTDSDEMWQEKYDQSVELFSRMCKALENFVSLKHHTLVSNVTLTRKQSIHVFYFFQHLQHAYYSMYYIPYSVPPTRYKAKKI